MAVTLPYVTLSGAINSAQLDANFSTLANKFGNIVNADIATGAALDIDKLSAQYERLLIRLTVESRIDSAAATDINGYNDASLSAVPITSILDTCPLPGDSSDANWSIYDVMWYCTDTGDGATVVRVDWGYSNAGVFAASSVAVANMTITNKAIAGDVNLVHAVNSSATALDFNHATGGNTPRALGLILVTAGVGTNSTEGSRLSVSLLLRRKIQAS